MKIEVDFNTAESVYREPTCYEKCVLGAKCGSSVGFILGSLLVGAGAVKTAPKGQRLRPTLMGGLFVGAVAGSILTGFVRYNC